jgi:exodeoxyribonuclease VII small subunit
MKLEETLAKLEETISNLENPEISLEEAFKEYQMGMEMLKKCHQMIDKVEKEVQVIMGDGETVEFE